MRQNGLEFKVLSIESPDVDCQCRRVHARRWLCLVCTTGPGLLKDCSFVLFIFFPRAKHRPGTELVLRESLWNEGMIWCVSGSQWVHGKGECAVMREGGHAPKTPA